MNAQSPQVRLENAPVEIIDGDRGKNYPSQNELHESGFCLFLSANNVTPDGFRFETCQFIDEAKDRALRKGRLTRNDVVMTTRGTLGNVGYYSSAIPHENVRINSGMVILRVDETRLRSRYLYFALQSQSTVQQINSLRSGAAQPQLPIRDIKKILVGLPEPAAQDRIVDLVAAYDDLIANNRRRIELLEQSARLLFKEWFVHLRYPGHEHDNVVDGVPEGWTRQPLSNAAMQAKEKVHPTDVAGNTVYVGLEHIPRRSVTILEWGTADAVTSDKYLFKERDILFAKIRPYLHKVGFALVDGITSSDAVVVRAQDQRQYCFLLHLLSSDLFIAVTSKTVREGSKMPRADWDYLMERDILIPSYTLIAAFDEIIEPILKQQRTLALAIRKLAEARDLLLPRLMDGRLTA